MEFKLTKAQAVAFLESILGWESMGPESDRRISPFPVTHLEAVLGAGEIPLVYEISSQSASEKVKNFLSYIRAVVETLDPKSRKGCSVPIDTIVSDEDGERVSLHFLSKFVAEKVKALLESNPSGACLYFPEADAIDVLKG